MEGKADEATSWAWEVPLRAMRYRLGRPRRTRRWLSCVSVCLWSLEALSLHAGLSGRHL